ncbi:zinc finger protein 853-like isoform X2 [Polyodon spathula]|uniref:zinc finger protein 853-like isoform X2 n=1 Tax=Polyodon spathula TaxID=7913 RepID=UPI001B7DC11B|nr:zinc finger protein 853-like isoform X2 [Polyodon spathula]
MSPPPLIKAYRCHMCEESFSAMGLLIEHQSAHAGQGLLFCGKCEGLFSCRDQLEQHQCTSCTYICTCGNGFPQYPALLEHMRSHDEGLPPGYPDPVAQARSHTLLADLVKQRQQEKGGGRAGTGAPAGFGEMVVLKLRFLPVVSIRRQEEEESVRGHKCGICGWTFVSLDLLIEHHTSHGADAVYGCRRCRRAVSSSVLLERHACAPRDLLGNGGSFRFDGVAVMQGQGQVPLGYVGDVSRRRGDLEKHQVSHLDGKPFHCHKCHRFYLQKSSLRKHRCPVSDRDPGHGLRKSVSHRGEQTVFIYKRSECAGSGGLGHGIKEVRSQVKVTFREKQPLTQPQPLTQFQPQPLTLTQPQPLTQFQPQPLTLTQPQPEPRPLLLIQSPLQSRLLPQTLPHLQAQLLSSFQTRARLQYQRQSPLLRPSQTSKALPSDRLSQSADWHKDRGPGCVRAKGPSWLDPKARLLILRKPESEPPLPLEEDFVFRSARGTRTYQRGNCSVGHTRPFVMPEPEKSSSEVQAGGGPPEEERSEAPPSPTKRKLELQFSEEEDDDCMIVEPNQQNNKEEEGRRRRRRAEEEHEPQNPRALPASRDCNGTDSRETDPPAGSREQEVLPPEEEEDQEQRSETPGYQRLEAECGKTLIRKRCFVPLTRIREEEEGEGARRKKTMTCEPGVKNLSVKPTKGGGGGVGGNLQETTTPPKRKLELEFSEEEEEDCVIVEPNQKKIKSEAEPQPVEILPASRGSNGTESRQAVYHGHQQRPDQTFRCLRCGTLFPQSEALARHSEACSRAPPQRGSPQPSRLLCGKCRTGFPSRAELDRHLRDSRCLQQALLTRQVCDRGFSDEQRLHGCQDPYRCPGCRESFARQGALQEHMRAHGGLADGALRQEGWRYRTGFCTVQYFPGVKEEG